MKVIGLGSTCYIKWLLNDTSYKKDTDIFDWMNSFEFEKVVDSINNGFNIFENIIKSPLNVDIKSKNVYFNELYNFRLPHEGDLIKSTETYKRRFERFLSYSNDTDNFLFIRLIHMGRYDIPAENLETNYSNDVYLRLKKYLPINSKILLITDKKLSLNDKQKISTNFQILDNVILPNHVVYGHYIQHRKQILKYYNDMLNYVSNNFNNFDPNIAIDFVKNENIGI